MAVLTSNYELGGVDAYQPTLPTRFPFVCSSARSPKTWVEDTEPKRRSSDAQASYLLIERPSRREFGNGMKDANPESVLTALKGTHNRRPICLDPCCNAMQQSLKSRHALPILCTANLIAVTP